MSSDRAEQFPSSEFDQVREAAVGLLMEAERSGWYEAADGLLDRVAIYIIEDNDTISGARQVTFTDIAHRADTGFSITISRFEENKGEVYSMGESSTLVFRYMPDPEPNDYLLDSFDSGGLRAFRDTLQNDRIIEYDKTGYPDWYEWARQCVEDELKARSWGTAPPLEEPFYEETVPDHEIPTLITQYKDDHDKYNARAVKSKRIRNALGGVAAFAGGFTAASPQIQEALLEGHWTKVLAGASMMLLGGLVACEEHCTMKEKEKLAEAAAKKAIEEAFIEGLSQPPRWAARTMAKYGKTPKQIVDSLRFASPEQSGD